MSRAPQPDPDPSTPRSLDAACLLEHEAWVRRLARRLVTGEEAVDEVVQQTWVNALLWPPRELANLRPWFTTVVRNVVRQRWRKEQTERTHVEASATRTQAREAADASLIRLETQRLVTRAVLGLRAAERTVIVLRYYEELSPTQMALHLGEPLATVKSRLARARARLRQKLEKSWPEGGDAWRHALILVAFGPAETAPTPGLPGPRPPGPPHPGPPVWLRPPPWIFPLVGGAAVIVGVMQILDDDPLKPTSEPAVVRVQAEPGRQPPPALPTGVERDRVAPAESLPLVVRPASAGTSAPGSHHAPRASEVAGPATAGDSRPADERLQAASTRSRIAGRIRFEGEVPSTTAVDLGSDPYCGRLFPGGLPIQLVKVSEGGLEGVFVSLAHKPESVGRGGPGGKVELRQSDCTFHPSLLGIRVDQSLEIHQDDDTLHNIHASPKVNKEFNIGMPNRGMQITRQFSKAERAIPISCDVHSWMKAWVFVMDHPYFGITDATGAVELPSDGLKDGRYAVNAWHPILGDKSGYVDVVGGMGRFGVTYTAE